MEWIKFYPGKFLLGVQHMTPDEVGCYIRLLCVQCIKDGLPTDFRKLSQLAGGMSEDSWATVREHFELCEDGELRNMRMAELMLEATSAREKARTAGRKGGLARAAKQKASDATSDALADAQQKEREKEQEKERIKEGRTQAHHEIHTMPKYDPSNERLERIAWADLLNREFGIDRIQAIETVRLTFDTLGNYAKARQAFKEAVETSRKARVPEAYMRGCIKKGIGIAR